MKYDIATISTEVEIITRVDEIVKEVEQKIADLKLDKIKATEENKKLLTTTRADLNKDVKKYEEDIKVIDKLVNAKLNVLKEQYKTKIKTLYSITDAQLKKKIEEITAQQLVENEDYSKEYYNNKLKSMPLRLGVRYQDIPWTFKFNSSKKSIRDCANDHFEKVEKALTVIDSHEYKTQLEDLWIKKGFDLGEALIELQSQLVLATKLMEQKEEAKRLKEENDAIIAAQAEARLHRKQEVAIEVTETFVAEPVEEALAVEEILTYSFKIDLTDKELEKLINFLADEDIAFELVE